MHYAAIVSRRERLSVETGKLPGCVQPPGSVGLLHVQRRALGFEGY